MPDQVCCRGRCCRFRSSGFGARGGDEHQRRYGNEPERQALRQVRGPGADGNVLVPRQHPAHRFLGIAGVQLDFDPRVLPPEAGQDIEQEAVTGSDGAEHADLAVQFTGCLHQGVANGIPLAQGVPGVVEEQAPGLRQRNTAVVALEQRRPGFLLQALNAAAQGGRADVSRAGGATEMQAVGEVQKVFQRSNVHPIQYCIKRNI